MTLEYYDLPAHWASALINGDDSGLEQSDLDALESFVDSMVEDCGQCWAIEVELDEGGDFRRYHDATQHGVPACDVAKFTFDTGVKK